MSSNWFKSTGSVFDIAVVTLSACVGLVSLYFGLKTNNSSSKTLAVLIVLVCTEILVFRLGMLFQRRRSRLATPAPTPQSAERKADPRSAAAEPQIFPSVHINSSPTMPIIDRGSNELDTRLVVTLVHGTFARDAEWTNANSMLCIRLSQLLSKRLVFRRFLWSGENSHTARVNAGAELANFIMDSSTIYQRAKQIVVAHSHGGNVALYALREPAVRTRISAIVCIATPFITCRIRNTSRVIAVMRYFGPIFVNCLFLLVALLYLLSASAELSLERPGMTLASWPGWFWLKIMLIGTAVTGTLFCVPVWQMWEESIVSWTTRRAEETFNLIRLPSNTIPILSIHTIGDEARFGLSIAHLLANLPYYLWRVCSWIFVPAGVVAVFIEGYGAVKLVLVEHGSRLVLQLFLLPTVIPIAVLPRSAAILLLKAVMLALPKIVRAHSLVFGGEGLIDNWLVDVGVSPVPENCGAVGNVHCTVGRRGLFGLKHCAIYEDSEALLSICRWLSLAIL